MGAILLREEWTSQPQYPVKVNPYSELAKKLVAYWPLAGNTRNILSGAFGAASPGATQAVTTKGRAYNFDGTDNGRIALGVDYLNSVLVNNFTIGCFITLNGTPDDGDIIISTGAGRTSLRVSAGNALIGHHFDGADRDMTGATALTTGKTYFVVWTKSSVTGSSLYVNGVLDASNAGSSYLADSANYSGEQACIGATLFAGTIYNKINAKISDLGVFNAALSAAEVLSYSKNPLQVLEDDILTVPFASSSNADLAGAAVVNPAASAAIALSVPMVAAGIVVATSGGAMQLALPMSGNATGQASSTGGVSLSVPLAVSALIQALATAGLSQSDPLAGNAAGVASGGSSMTLNVSMAGAALIEALAAANLTVTGDGMSGSAIVQPSVTGNMSLGLPLVTSSLVVSNMSGTLTQIVPMQASSASASLVTGGLDLAATLNTAALIEALAVVSLSTDKNMGGAGAANASTMGNLTLRVNMSTAAIIQAAAAGALAGNGQLAGTPGYRITRAARSWKVTRKPRTWRVSA